jgi:KUP system potassium uptake protein
MLFSGPQLCVVTCLLAVLSAVSGLGVGISGLKNDAIVAITCVILVLLFVGQRFGSGLVGSTFAPIVITWFTANAGIGVYK